MDCERARMVLEQLAMSGGAGMDAGVEAHLAECTACQEWYVEELELIGALDALEPFPTPPDFTGRVLNRLQAVPSWQAVVPPSRSKPRPLPWWANIRESLRLGLAALTERRALAPALAVAVAVVLLLGLWSSLQQGHPSITPGAALSDNLWLVGGVLGLGALALLLALLFSRR